ncbi:T9SS type A sorting domain-containing protein [Polaribacter sp. MSW13]|uniref:T9SS type A sorting domain-containing protein n=1 Tax=Polaribacter marinus TaxID=2916838 RepID=A0A9X1VNX2_9FLAO|nr:choice-of-anchor J domain-containing protein [Polaribacter marinus]MCI2229667.1 T9SS type A sorting domain-containing protein [Polaribacter marinus]
MKKITLLFLLLTISFSAHAQFPESFDGGVLPTGWTTYIGANGLGTSENWIADVNGYMYCTDENAGGVTEDWLVSPSVSITATNSLLSFYEGTLYTSVYEPTTMYVKVSTTSQTDISSFTTVSSLSATDVFGGNNSRDVDLSAYIGETVYIAWVLEQDYGDGWIVDDIFLTNPNAAAPNCATDPTPVDGATGVVLNSGEVTIGWTAPATGDIPTSYEVFWGTTSGSLTSLGFISSTTVDITNVDLSTTYYWMIVPKNSGGSSVGCAEWSFTTEDPPPPPVNDTLAGAIPIVPSAEGTGCTSSGFTLNFSTDGTTDSGMDGSCNGADTGLDQFFTWTATTEGLMFNDASPGNPGIVIRDLAGNEIACASTYAADNVILDGWNIGDDLIIQIYDYGTTVSDVAFCLELYTPPAPIVPNYSNNFDVFPGDGWFEATGAFMDPSGSTSSFDIDDFKNDVTHANGNSARVNIYGSSTDEYLISNKFDLSGGTYYLNFDLALTKYNDTAVGTFGADDYLALLVTQDDGATWTELARWDSANPILEAEEAISEITLAGYNDNTYFAFYAYSDTSNEDNDLFIDNFQITGSTLGIAKNNIDGFSLFPTLVKDKISFTSLENIESFDVFNLLGQQVFSTKINAKKAELNLSTLTKGVYIVKVKSGDSIGSYKILKE